MSFHQTACSTDQIERYLQQDLLPDDERAFEQHLEACDACRRQLEQSAAESRWWEHASDFLKSDPWDSELGDGSATAGPALTMDEERPSHVVDFLDPTDDPRMLGRFGGYEIVGVVGYGGMGIVLKGFDGALNRYVAIKVLTPHLATRGTARQRFAREAQAAAAVVHENVIAIHSVAESNGLPFLVMPYVRGPSLQKRIEEQGPLRLAEVLRIGMQIASGLAAAHAQGLVHRDIKPANILLDNGVERVTITDFGLARAVDDASLTRTGMIAGTPLFMSPEQARGDTVDHRSDLFSLGSVLYAACTGRPPFRAENAFGVLRRITDSSPRPIRETAPDTPEWLCGIVQKLLTKDRAERFQSAAEVTNLLEQCLAHVQQPATVSLPNAASKLCRHPLAGAKDGNTTARKRIVRSLLLAAGLLLLAGIVGIAVVSNRDTDKPDVDAQPNEGAALDASDSTVDDDNLPPWQDDVNREILELDDLSAELELRAGRLWD